MKTILPAIILSLTLLGCGYIDSGVWENHPNNWIRAFNESKPDGIDVVHSRYMSTPHWSHEFEYFFHLRPSDLATKRFTQPPGMKPYTSKDELFLPVDSFFQEKPAWFLPKELVAYDIWIRSVEPRGNFRVFKDRESGDLYITENQI